jgi:hypothetical protein
MSDGDLYTGITSASQRTRREQVNQDKLEKKARLLPVAEIIKKAIQDEKAQVANVRDFVVTTSTTDAEMRADIMARQRYLTYLDQFNNKINVILKAEPIKGAKDED